MKYRIRSSSPVTRFLLALFFTLLLAPSARFGLAKISAATATNSARDAAGTGDEKIIPTPPIISLSATPSTTQIAIAEPFTLRMEVIAPHGSHVTWEAIHDSLDGFDVLQLVDSPDVPLSSTHSTWLRLLTLETIQLGPQTIPPIHVSVQIGDAADTQSVQQLQTKPISIDVKSVLAPSEQDAPNEYRDIAGTIALPAQSSDPSAGLPRNRIIAAVAVGLLVLAVWLWRRTKRSSRSWGLRQLQILKQRPIGDASSYIETSEALKQVLHVSVTDLGPTGRQPRTTPALIDALIDRQCADGEIKNFATAFQCADRLKFSASHDLSFSATETAALRDAIEHAYQMIAARTKATKAESGEPISVAPSKTGQSNEPLRERLTHHRKEPG